MPTYEYICRACGREFEEFQSITAPPVRKCPRCGKRRVERKIGLGGGVLFKGGGFYETDYRSASFKSDEKKEADSAKPKSEGETKPADKGAKPADKTDKPAKPTQASAAEKSASEKHTEKPKTPDTSAEARRPGKAHARAGRGVGNLRQISRQNRSTSGRAKGKR